MKCKECNHETYIDHVENKGKEEIYWYTCVNPQCGQYRKAYTLMGSEQKSQIKSQ